MNIVQTMPASGRHIGRCPIDAHDRFHAELGKLSECPIAIWLAPGIEPPGHEQQILKRRVRL